MKSFRWHGATKLPRSAAIACLAVGVLLAAGCTAESGPNLDRADAQLKVLGIMYGKYMRQHGGKPPGGEEQFVAYLTANKEAWEQLVDSPTGMLLSPYDGQPLAILYGEEFSRGGESLWVAREQTGVDGQYRIVSARGEVRRVEEATLGDYFSIVGRTRSLIGDVVAGAPSPAATASDPGGGLGCAVGSGRAVRKKTVCV